MKKRVKATKAQKQRADKAQQMADDGATIALANKLYEFSKTLSASDGALADLYNACGFVQARIQHMRKEARQLAFDTRSREPGAVQARRNVDA